MRYGLLGMALAACSGEGTTDGGPGTNTSEDPFDQFVNVEQAVGGDFSCFTPAADPAWLDAGLDPAKVASFTVNGAVEDFEEGTAVADATVDLFLDDQVDGAPDQTAVSDQNGVVSASADSCSPLSYRVTKTSGPILAKTTFKSHQIFGYPTGATIEGASFTSVSDTTYQLIPGILNIDVQSDLAIVAGTAFDCTRDPSLDPDDPTGKIENAQIIVYDEDGNIPDTMSVNYFVEEFPASDQKFTSADGLWVASNVPPGRLTIEMWGNVDGELVKLGASILDTQADTIAIANLFAGYGDGVKAPDSCAVAR